MHNNCREIFSGFCRKPVLISELVSTTCFEINEFEAHSFPIFRDQAESESEKGHEGGGMAEAGEKEEEKG